jgi:uncharacterized protein (TIGR03032 family)
MSTSQLLRDLIGSRALIVSSQSNNKVLSLQNDVWSDINVENARGLSYNDNFVTVASSNCINFYNKNTGVFAGTINSYAYDIHEIEFIDNNEIIACDSRASSLTRLSLGSKSITWTVPGVDLDTTDSRSFVNGVCIENNLPKYVTVLGVSNVENGWRDEANQSRSALINVQTNEIILHNLIFPHSPTLDGETVYFLNSGLNQVCKWSPGDSDFTIISTLNGWTRGLIILDQYLLIGVSQGRQSAVPNVISNQLDEPGIAIVDKVTGELVEFESLDVREIFDLIISDKALS